MYNAQGDLIQKGLADQEPDQNIAATRSLILQGSPSQNEAFAIGNFQADVLKFLQPALCLNSISWNRLDACKSNVNISYGRHLQHPYPSDRSLNFETKSTVLK